MDKMDKINAIIFLQKGILSHSNFFIYTSSFFFILTHNIKLKHLTSLPPKY